MNGDDVLAAYVAALPPGPTLKQQYRAAQARLTVELVPRTCWYSNVRSEVSAADWDLCKRFVRERSNDRCEICGGRGRRWPVECHEVWSYELDESQAIMPDRAGMPDRITGTQRLVGLIALCPACHEVKHVGRAEAMGHLQRAVLHLTRVNGWTQDDALTYLEHAFEVWDARSQVEWTLDISYLTEVLGP